MQGGALPAAFPHNLALASRKPVLNCSSVAFGRYRDTSRPTTPMAPRTVCISEASHFRGGGQLSPSCQRCPSRGYAGRALTSRECRRPVANASSPCESTFLNPKLLDFGLECRGGNP